MTDQGKLKATLDDIKSRLKVNESKIDLHGAILESTKTELNRMTEKKDNMENLKQNHKAFTESYNNTIKDVYKVVDVQKSEMNQKFDIQDEKRLELKSEIDNKISELETKIISINKILDF